MRRKRTLIVSGVTSIAILAIALTGPRVEIDTRLKTPLLPADLETYIANAEASVVDLVPGTEKKIVWFDEAGVQTPLSIVYLHGFSASRKETEPLSDRVAESLGANLYYNRFSGHGRTARNAMAEGTVNAWLNDANEALEIGKRLGERVILIGTSTGSNIATWLASRDASGSIAALVLLSPNFEPADGNSRILLWPWGRQIAELTIGLEFSWTPRNPEHARYWTHSYPTRALVPMMGLVSLMRSIHFEELKAPTMVIYSPSDQVISPKAVESAFAKMGSPLKALVPFTGSESEGQHVLAGDILSPNSTDALATLIVDFISDSE